MIGFKGKRTSGRAFTLCLAALICCGATAAQETPAPMPAPAPTPAAVSMDPGLQSLLGKTQESVEKFFEEFSLIRYEENIVQQKLRENERVAYKQETVYDSIIRMRFEEGKLRVDEQRLTERLPRKPESRPLLNTYGFSTLAMIFHPYYAASFRFTSLGSDTINGQALTKVHFEHLPGTPTPVLYQLIGGDKPMDLSGTGWIDSATGDIHRLQVDFGFPSENIGVKTIRAELAYAPVTLENETEPRVLPTAATIDLETARQHWRNIHHFADYRRYRVSTNVPGVSTQ